MNSDSTDAQGEVTNDPIDSRSVDDWIASALGGTEEDDAYWDAVFALRRQHDDPAILERALALSTSACPHERALAASILGHDLDRPSPEVDNRLAALRIMLHAEADPNVLRAILFALGHLHRPGVVDSALPYAHHPDADLRYAVIHALCGHDDDHAIAALIALSRDPVAENRDWATFGLGSQTDRDTPDLRAALVARLDDADPTVVGEALVGLARRRDGRGHAPLRDLLAAHDVGSLEIEAARLWADPAFLPLLQALDRTTIEHAYGLDDAIVACQGPALMIGIGANHG